MNTTGLFTIHRFQVLTSGLEPVNLNLFSDIHRSSKRCDADKWREYLRKWRRDKTGIFLGVGDYDDLMSASERKALLNGNLHEDTIEELSESMLRNVQRFYREIGFMKGRLVGLIEGNHYGVFGMGEHRGKTTTEVLAELMGCKYLGVCSFIRLVFVRKDGHSIASDIWVHHGKGAASLMGGSLNRVQRMAQAAEADIYVMAHDHQKVAGVGERLMLVQDSHTENGIRLSHRKQIYARTCGFLRGYVEDRSSYIADAALNPTILGATQVRYSFERIRKGGQDRTVVDLQAII